MAIPDRSENETGIGSARAGQTTHSIGGLISPRSLSTTVAQHLQHAKAILT